MYIFNLEIQKFGITWFFSAFSNLRFYFLCGIKQFPCGQSAAFIRRYFDIIWFCRAVITRRAI